MERIILDREAQPGHIPSPDRDWWDRHLASHFLIDRQSRCGGTVSRKLLKDATELRESNSQVSFSMRGSMSYFDRARKRTRVTLHFLKCIHKRELSATGRLHRYHSEDHTSPRHCLRRASLVSR